MDRANATLADQGFQYGGTTKVKHLLWMLFEDIGIDRVTAAIKRKLTGLKIAPFYGCYILRPEESLGLKERPERKTYLERLIALLGAEPVEYRGSTKCCGFPMLTFNRDKALAMGGNHIMEAKEKGADLLVTPCPLCHLNLDGQQPDAARVLKKDIGVPIFHLPQLLGLAFGMDPAELRLNHHVVPTKGALEKVELKV
jgi:succinate dehydrogenase / fumarate reductase cytochrome b subunit